MENEVLKINKRNKTSLHLELVGSFIEHLPQYQKPRLNAVKDMILQVLDKIEGASAGLPTIKAVLCFKEIPLVNQDVLRTALRELINEDKIEKVGETYRLKVEIPQSKSNLRELLTKAWSKFFEASLPNSYEIFLNFICVFFARYGTNAYEGIAGSSSFFDARILSVIKNVMPMASIEEMDIFEKCVKKFIDSEDPEISNIKVKLAKAYTVLRMNGAGNWEQGSLEDLLGDKILLLDTNILYELLDSHIEQMSKLFDALKACRATVIYGKETRNELEKSITRKIENIKDFLLNGGNIQHWHDIGLIKADWIDFFLEKGEIKTEVDIDNIAKEILTSVDKWLSKNCPEPVSLETKLGHPSLEQKAKEVIDAFKKCNGTEKKQIPAEHDALLWEAIDNDNRIADWVISKDHSLLQLRTRGQNGRRFVLMFDKLITLTLLGLAEEVEIAGLLCYEISNDLISDNTSLDFDDIKAISQMEQNVLNAPDEVLLNLSKEVNDYRKACAHNGESANSQTIQRIALNNVINYDKERKKLSEEQEKNKGLVKEKKDLQQQNDELKGIERKWEEDRNRVDKLEERNRKLEEKVDEILLDKKEAEAGKVESDKLKEKYDKNRIESEKKEKLKSDWMLFLALILIFALLAIMFVDIFIIPYGVIFLVVLTMFWISLAKNTPQVSFKVFGSILAIILIILGIVEKCNKIEVKDIKNFFVNDNTSNELDPK